MTPIELNILRQNVKRNTVVQIQSGTDHNMIGMLVEVEETHSWGIEGYTRSIIRNQNDKAEQVKIMIRLNWNQIGYVGQRGETDLNP